MTFEPVTTPVINPHFGPLKRRGQIIDAVIETIQEWQSEYLAEIERQTGRVPKMLPLIKAFERTTGALNKHVGSNLPAVAVRCPGTTAQPVRRKKGTEATYGVLVSVVVSGVDDADTEDLADVYCAALLGLIEHNRDLGGVVTNVTWTDALYNEIPSDVRDTLGAGTLTFDVTLDDVVKSRGGPIGDPLVDPYEEIRPAIPVVVEDGVDVEMHVTEGAP